MGVLHDRCAGLDIGKKNLKACVRTPPVWVALTPPGDPHLCDHDQRAAGAVGLAGRREGHVGGDGGDR